MIQTLGLQKQNVAEAECISHAVTRSCDQKDKHKI